MKRLIFIALVSSALCFPAKGQVSLPDGYQLADSLYYHETADLDSTLYGRDIFNFLSGGGSAAVRIHQSSAVKSMVESQIESNRSRKMRGYRIRIFFDKSQSARSASEAALYRFKVLNPGVSAYRSFSSPYFRVTVGDYRNKSEALAALGAIKQQFPAAFIVQERFKYPAVENRSAYRVDTLKVLKKVN